MVSWSRHQISHGTWDTRDLNKIFYEFAGPDGQYIGLGDDNGVCSDDSPTEFKFEFCGLSVMIIRAPNGCYLKGGQNGLLRAVAEDRASATLWEY